MWGYCVRYVTDCGDFVRLRCCGCCISTEEDERSKLLADKDTTDDANDTKSNDNDNAAGATTTDTPATSASASASATSDEHEAMLEELRANYKQDITHIFWLLAGQSPYSKNKIYMRKQDLHDFLSIVKLDNETNIIEKNNEASVNKIFNKFNSDQITITEFVDYFVDVNTNPDCIALREKIISTRDWQLMRKSLKIFKIIDKDQTGDITFDKFKLFCQLININDENEMIELFKKIDINGTDSIGLAEMLAWFKERLKNELQSNNE